MILAVRPDRRLSLMVAVIGGLVFVGLAAWLVPWQWVPGGHYAHVSADEVFSPTQIRRGTHYSSMQRHLGWAAYAVSMVVLLVLGFTRLGRCLVDRLPGRWWVRAPLAVAAVLVIGDVATLWFGIREQQHALAYGLSNQAWSGWWTDLGLGLGVTWVGTSIAVLVLIGVARRAPRRWPVIVAGLAAALAVLGSFVYPVLVQPLFNDFTSLPKGALRTDIMRLARAEHVRIDDVLVADASKRTTTLDAYVSGFGSTRRVVLHDNTVRDLPRRQVLVVVAHELGHAHHRDVVLGTALGAVGGVAGVGLLGLVLSSGWVRRRAGVSALGEAQVVPLVLALAAVGTFVVSPVQNTISRSIEARADRASIEATHDYAAFTDVQRRLATSSLADPTPPSLSQFWFGTHPTALQRVGIADALRDR